MTIPMIYRTLALLIAAILVTGGVLLVRARDGAPEGEPAAAAAVAALEARVADLEEQVEVGGSEDVRLSEQVASVGRKLERQVDSLRASMRDLRGAVGDARSGARSARERAETAAGRAETALARAEELARDLRVLEDRFNVHMRRHHGGG